MDTQQLFLAALRSFSRKTKKTMKWECGPLGMRDVKDRDAELRMEWDSDYTIAVAECIVAELKKQVEEFRARR